MNLIFDFDGTIVDSLQKVIEKFNILADEFHFQKIQASELADLRELNSRELVEHLKIPLYKIPIVLYQARKYMNNEMPTLAPFATLHGVLQQLYNAKCSLGILSSNSHENVTTWLALNNMNHYFNFIHTESSYLGKNFSMKNVLKKHGINKQETFYIGDETRDIDAAKRNGIYSIAVTWGFNSEKVLLQHRPHYIARKPEDLLEICGLKSNLVNSN